VYSACDFPLARLTDAKNQQKQLPLKSVFKASLSFRGKSQDFQGEVFVLTSAIRLLDAKNEQD
jgi:hypothetical protein